MRDDTNDRQADFLAGIDQLAPVITAHRAALDRERRLPEPLFDAIAEAGLLRLWLPKALGGPELSPHDFMAVVEAAAALDGSVGWIIGNGAGMSRIGGYLPELLVRDWFGDPRAFVVAATGAFGAAVPVDGGYRVTGRWPFGSGIHHASHVMGLCQIADGRAADAAPSVLCCHFPKAAVSVIDNWHVSGLRGTGSCDFTAQDIFVANEQCCAFPESPPSQPGPLYRIPNAAIFSWTVAVVPLGIARGALSAFAQIAEGRGLRERETVQSIYGRAEACHAAARAFLLDAMTRMMDAAAARPLDRPAESDPDFVRARAAYRMACAHAAETAAAIAQDLAAAAGSAAIMESGTLERCLRDIQAAGRHVAMSPNNYILGGRLALGVDQMPVRG